MKKNVDFLFEYEVKSRELDSICLVGAYLRSKGYTVAYLNSWDSLFKKPKAYSTKVMCISACYNDGVYDSFTGLAYSFDKVINFQWEQICTNYYFDPHEYEFVDYIGTALQTRHVCWGQRELKRMEDLYGVGQDYLAVLGYLPLDFYRQEFRSLLIPRDQLFTKYGLDPNKPTCLFVSSFAVVGLPDTEKYNKSNERELLIAESSIKSQKELLTWFETFVTKHPEIQFIYRYHPTEKNNPIIKELTLAHSNLFALSEMPIKHWIAACDKVYNWCSTSMIEMMYIQKNTYILRPFAIPSAIDMPIFQNAAFIETYEDFEKSALDSANSAFPVQPCDLQSWYDTDDEPTYKRIGDWLIDTYHDSTYQSRPSVYNVHRSSAFKNVKTKIEQTKMFSFFAACCHQLVGETAFTKRLLQAKKDACNLKTIRSNLYGQSKRELNCASELEIAEKLTQYQKIIEQAQRS